MIKAGIVGAAGYAGINLINILLQHPEVKIAWVMSEPAHTGKKLSALYPHLEGKFDLVCEEPDPVKQLSSVELIFFATPNALAMKLAPAVLAAGKKVIDLSADFRFPKVAVFESWYKVKHASPELLAQTVYGLPELHRDQITRASLIGNPGCYPTASILGLAPLIKENLIDPAHLVIDAKSGLSGAGRSLTLTTHFTEANEGVSAYALGSHRHLPEIEQELTLVGGKPIKVSFTPHLVPMTRGLIATIYTVPSKKITLDKLTKSYRDFYKTTPFVRITDLPPSTKHVLGTNRCVIHPHWDERTGRIIIISVIDNLGKGASGQAIQNMNLMFGFPEDQALKNIALYP